MMRRLLRSEDSHQVFAQLRTNDTGSVSKKEILEAARILYRAYKCNAVSRVDFEEVVRSLLVVYSDNVLERKLSGFTRDTNEKAFRLEYPEALIR